MSHSGITALVAWPWDRLADAIERALRARGKPVIRLEPGTLSGRSVTLDARGLELEGERVKSVLWRTRPDSHFSDDFVLQDQLFSDIETRAFWLAALHSAALVAPFRPPAAAFFTGGGWFLWRHFMPPELELSPLSYGAAAEEGYWLPYHHAIVRPGLGSSAASLLGAATLHRSPGGRLLFVGSEVVGSNGAAEARDADLRPAVDALRRFGVTFAEILLDSKGAVLAIDPFPEVADPEILARTTHLLTELLDATVDHW